VGQACGDNRLPIVIPCHRVVAADGIGGFAHATGG
jgi:methylated-DNA-[protein]-cysteine S-methyltransferase